jgi:hypothetical protein
VTDPELKAIFGGRQDSRPAAPSIAGKEPALSEIEGAGGRLNLASVILCRVDLCFRQLVSHPFDLAQGRVKGCCAMLWNPGGEQAMLESRKHGVLWAQEGLAVAALIFQFALLGLFWSDLPASVPTHYGFSGRPDQYGAKSSLFLSPLIACLLYGLLTVVSFLPETFNYPVQVTDENRARLQTITQNLLRWLKLELTWSFAYDTWSTIRVCSGTSAGLGQAFVPLMLVVVSATAMVAIFEMRRAQSSAG